MVYVVFNPKTKMAYCRREHPLSTEQLFTQIRCREFEYRNYIRPIGKEFLDIIYNGGLEDIRVAVTENITDERPWPYREFHSYAKDYDFQLWLDTTPRAKIYPIQSIDEYEKEIKEYKNKYYNKLPNNMMK